MSAPLQPVKLLLGAIGGQGGGLLGDWIDLAAHHAGFPCQTTSTPGVAQRTGATIYYVELFPDRAPAGEPVFCLYPTPGDIDLVATLEPLEAGRALDRGFVTARTTLISPVDRIYSTAEKVIAGDGRVDLAALFARLRAAAGQALLFDGGGLGLSLNAALLGAVAASGVLPLDADDFRHAIETRGLAVRENLAGFETGLGLTDSASVAPETPHFEPPPAVLATAVAALPAPLQPLAGHAVARLVDYQGLAYARHYLERLGSVLASEPAAGGEGLALTRQVARRLGAWMGYEDVIRIAQLKTRPGRLARIRREVGAANGDGFVLYEYLRPGRAEIAALLPAPLAAWLMRGAHRGPGPDGRGLKLRTSSPWGFGLLRLLAALRPLRPRGAGFAAEQASIERWLAAVRLTATRDYHLACALAELAFLARGYGEVRRRDLARLEGLLDDWPEQLDADPDAAAARLHALLATARTDPDLEHSTEQNR